MAIAPVIYFKVAQLWVLIHSSLPTTKLQMSSGQNCFIKIDHQTSFALPFVLQLFTYELDFPDDLVVRMSSIYVIKYQNFNFFEVYNSGWMMMVYCIILLEVNPVFLWDNLKSINQ